MRTFDNANDALVGTVNSLVQAGDKVSPRGLETREIADYLLEIKDPTDGICTLADRKVNYSLVAFEYASYLGGLRGDVKHAREMVRIAPNYANFVDDTHGRMNGMYGVEIGSQLPLVIELLSRDPDTRQARVAIFDYDDLERAVRPMWKGHEKDIPCTCSLAFRIRERGLDMTVTMRSNDVHLGATYDFAAFTLIQRTVAAILGIPVGRYRHFAESMHVYVNEPYKMEDVVKTMRGEAIVQLHQPDFSELSGPTELTPRERYEEYRNRLGALVDKFLYHYHSLEKDEAREYRDEVDYYFQEDPIITWVWRGMTGRMRCKS